MTIYRHLIECAEVSIDAIYIAENFQKEALIISITYQKRRNLITITAKLSKKAMVAGAVGGEIIEATRNGAGNETGWHRYERYSPDLSPAPATLAMTHVKSCEN